MQGQLLTESASRISLKPLVTQPPSPYCEVSVIVPVRDEAETLFGTLAALAHQIDLAGNPLARECYEIILLANNCSDDSVAIAQSFAKQHPMALPHPFSLLLEQIEQPQRSQCAWVEHWPLVPIEQAIWALPAST